MKKMFFLSAVSLLLGACGENAPEEPGASNTEPVGEQMVQSESLITEEEEMTEEFNNEVETIEFGEKIELQEVDIKPIETAYYPEGIGGYEESLFEFVFEVTNKTGELASPTYLSFWNTTMVSDDGVSFNQLEERLPDINQGLNDEQAERMNRGDLKPGQTTDVSVWYATQNEDPIYLYTPELNVLVPIILD